MPTSNSNTIVDDQQQQQQSKAATTTTKRYRSFDDMPLHMNLLRGIYGLGWESPADIQQHAIVPIVRGGDVVVQDRAGAGKTGAFAIGALARVDCSVFRTQALILSPTRELAQQTFDVTLGLGEYLFPADRDAQPHPVALLSAGTKPHEDAVKLQRSGSTIACGTPGRVLQLLEKGALRPERLRVLVLDEADELLSQGFQEQLAKIFRFLPRDIQIVLVSATLPAEVLALADKFMRDPTRVLLAQQRDQQENEPATTARAIKQYHVACDAVDEKMLVIADLYERISIAQSIIFCNSRRRAEWIAAELNKQHFTVALTHGELSREERDSVMKAFRGGEQRVLVSTDLIGRGIDVYHVNIVINFELPTVPDKYVHRIGRCGRFGRKGAAINLLAPGVDVAAMRTIEAAFGVSTQELPMDFDKIFA